MDAQPIRESVFAVVIQPTAGKVLQNRGFCGIDRKSGLMQHEKISRTGSNVCNDPKDHKREAGVYERLKQRFWAPSGLSMRKDRNLASAIFRRTTEQSGHGGVGSPEHPQIHGTPPGRGSGGPSGRSYGTLKFWISSLSALQLETSLL